MKKIMSLALVIVVASVAGCATSPSQNTAAYTAPKAYQYNASNPDQINTSNPGSLYNASSSENNDL